MAALGLVKWEFGFPVPLSVVARSDADLPFVILTGFTNIVKVLLCTEDAAAQMLARAEKRASSQRLAL
jgi:hypothetical protein